MASVAINEQSESPLRPGWVWIRSKQGGGWRNNDLGRWTKERPVVGEPELEKVVYEEPDLTEHPDEDFCLGRALCMDADEAKRVVAELHTSYKIYGWFCSKGFVFHSVQCDSKPAPGQILCKTCLKRKAKYEESGSSNKSKWHGIYGDEIPKDSHTRGSTWAESVMDGCSPPKSV